MIIWRDRLKFYWLQSYVFTIDRAPWFARKRLLNWFMGREHFHDFHQAEAATDPARKPISGICIKW